MYSVRGTVGEAAKVLRNTPSEGHVRLDIARLFAALRLKPMNTW